ncbi:MAG TPA: tripartite tricarboxylate transporter TctB family protein [Pilimelia sp.]|nr:tripartite tricarboxylate transporter TctB family protein [Pilimelia sp.]
MTTDQGAGEVPPGTAPGAVPEPSYLGPRVVGGVLLASGLFLLYEAVTAAGDDGFALDGPWWAPLAVTAGWTILAAIYLVRVIVVPARDYPPDLDPDVGVDGEAGVEGEAGAPGHAHWRTPGLVLGLLVLYALLYDPLGFVLATVAFFVGAARVLGSHHLVRDVLAGAGLALAAYLAFTRLLDVNLPAGVLPL